MIASDCVIPAQNLFGDSNGIMALDALAISSVNEAMDAIARETLMFNGTITNPANILVSPLDLSATADLILIKRVLYDSGPLALLEQETIDRTLAFPVSAGIPRGYFIDGNSLYLFPTPLANDAKVVVVTYAKYPVHIVALSGTLPVPEVWKTDITNYVTMRFHERNENWKAAEVYNLKWSAAMSSRKYEGQSREDTYRTVGIDPMDMEIYGRL